MRKLVIAATALLLSACAQTWDEQRPGSAPGGTGIMADSTIAEGPGAVSSVNALPAYTRSGVRMPYGSGGEAAAYEHAQGYRVGAADKLTIRVIGEEELTNDYLVDGSGHISIPYVGPMDVGGGTAPQIERLIVARLKKSFIRDPKVSVQVTELRPFFILGEVTDAGSFAYQPGMTIQNAVAIAGGYSARADQGAVLITRRNVKGTETVKAPVTTQVYPGDVIYVRERWF